MNCTLGKIYLITITLVVVSCNTEEILTEADYRRAESFLADKTEGLVDGLIAEQYWQVDDQLIYTETFESGTRYMLADPSSGEKNEVFDHQQLAQSLSEAIDATLDAYDLQISELRLNEGKLTYQFGQESFTTDLNNYETQRTGLVVLESESLSPDGNKAAYIKDHNLWIRDTQTGRNTQVTFDGSEDYGYATNNAGWIRRDTPVLLWSDDSKKIATFRHDGRRVGMMYLYDTQVGHSELDAWRYPLPGDDYIFMIERIIVHLDGASPRITKLNMPPDPHRSTTSDHVASWPDWRFLDVAWSSDNAVLSFVSSSRDHKKALLQVANSRTGAVRPVLNEEVDTYYEGGYSSENWRVLTETNEVIWFSERTDWGHLYLYDLQSGELKNPITSGEWAVLDVQRVDKEKRHIYFTGSNREDGDPYFHYLYRVNFDGSDLTLLTPESGHHTIEWSASGNYFTDSYSTPDTPPITVIRDNEGNVVMELAKATISRLENEGWVPPIPFTVKARDGKTELYGLMYTPSNIDESKKYPVLNYLYPGPQTGSVGSRSFRASRSDKQAVAELGFIVVEVDAMGTPGRSKSFHDAYYGNMGDNGLPDQITTIQQLAERHSFMDIDRVGIWGHSGGGFASTAGILKYPDFYKVAVSSSGNHDNRNYEDDWGEKWHGLLERNPQAVADDGEAISGEIPNVIERDNYDKQANQLLAGNLRGKLLLAHGMLDDNVPPTNTFLVAEELIKANKEFDMLMLPNSRHGYGEHSKYFQKKRWNYFVEHLKGVEPIHDFTFEE